MEIDLLVELSNQRFIAVEIKSKAKNFSEQQNKLLDSLNLNIVDRWVVVPGKDILNQEKVVRFEEIWKKLQDLNQS